jgi:hypothetical protein
MSDRGPVIRRRWIDRSLVVLFVSCSSALELSALVAVVAAVNRACPRWGADQGRRAPRARLAGIERQPVLGGIVQTLKYGPEFPDRFGSFNQAREFMDTFTHW